MAMKRTLLELTQDILASMDGDDVSAIADTAESAQVANIIRQCFYEIAANAKLPEHFSMFELTETSTSSPTIMTKPTDVLTIDWIKYDNMLTADSPVTSYQPVVFQPWDEFWAALLQSDSDATEVSRFNYTVGADTIPFVYRNDQFPMFYSTYNDSTLVFDSFNSAEDTFLRKTKTICYGLKESSWTHTDSAVPILDHKLSNLLFQNAKSQAFLELKQVENGLADRKSRRGWLTLYKEKHDIKGTIWDDYYDPKKLPHFGRK